MAKKSKKSGEKKGSNKAVKAPAKAKCEVTGCRTAPAHAIKMMQEHKWYCEKHFKDIFKELNAISDTQEEESEN